MEEEPPDEEVVIDIKIGSVLVFILLYDMELVSVVHKGIKQPQVNPADAMAKLNMQHSKLDSERTKDCS